jgi:murein L,D-transpeptidase YafK
MKLLLLAALVILACSRTVNAQRSTADVVKRYGPAAEARLKPRFAQAGVAYPPKSVAFIGLKEERLLQLWAGEEGALKLIHAYPVQAASGGPGPKLREGDRQVPEGLYKIAHLNPNSSYHLSMKVSYPNDFDRARAKEDGRARLGGDIFIHGKDVSIGCLALGDRAIEELFVLVAGRGLAKTIPVLIVPYDFRAKPAPAAPRGPSWLKGLYTELEGRLKEFKS